MAQLDSRLTKEDLDVLIEAMGDWETIGNQEFHAMNMVKSAVLPPEEDPSYEFVKQLKEHFQQREKDIRDARSVRQEKAILVKCKLMLNKSDMGIEQLFADARMPIKEFSTPATSATLQGLHPDTAKLRLAEQFIEECSITSHYQKFLKDKAEEATGTTN